MILTFSIPASRNFEGREKRNETVNGRMPNEPRSELSSSQDVDRKEERKKREEAI